MSRFITSDSIDEFFKMGKEKQRETLIMLLGHIDRLKKQNTHIKFRSCDILEEISKTYTENIDINILLSTGEFKYAE